MVLGIVAAACIAAATAALVRMHLLPTGLHPVRDAVSDFGTTDAHLLYRAMVVTQGGGAALLAFGLARETGADHLVWLWVYAVTRIAIAGFMTDRDPPPFTAAGRIHLALAAAAFTAIALAATGIRWAGAPGVLEPLGYAVAVAAAATLIARLARPLRDVFGLVQRLLYATSIAWLAVAAIDLIGR